MSHKIIVKSSKKLKHEPKSERREDKIVVGARGEGVGKEHLQIVRRSAALCYPLYSNTPSKYTYLARAFAMTKNSQRSAFQYY